jgi:4,5-DOPA dioxygenase extradiol
MAQLPSIFVSHGGPTMATQSSPARSFLTTLSEYHPEPEAIAMVSAHWQTERPAVGNAEEPETIHDFYGFPDEFYQIHYPAAGNPVLSQRIAALVEDAGLGAPVLQPRGLDHGAWLPLMLAYPEADIPVVQISLLAGAGPQWHFRLGRALRPLRDHGVLILASGAATHNLAEMDRAAPANTAVNWAAAFSQWLSDAVSQADEAALLNYRDVAPNARRNHPSEEHLLPLYVALGAATPGSAGRHLHHSFNAGVLAMDAYAWE